MFILIKQGLYPESHGIVGNTMYDFGGAKFSIGADETMNKRWWGGEPVSFYSLYIIRVL